MMIMGDAFPRAQARRRALRQHAGIDRRAWEIMIALDHDRVVAVGDHRAVPPCLNHHRLLCAIISSYCRAPRRPRPWSKDCSHWAFSAFRPWVCAFRGSIFFGSSEEDTSELQSLMRISYPVFCLKQKQQ